jgi:hypothetical protein
MPVDAGMHDPPSRLLRDAMRVSYEIDRWRLHQTTATPAQRSDWASTVAAMLDELKRTEGSD